MAYLKVNAKYPYINKQIGRCSKTMGHKKSITKLMMVFIHLFCFQLLFLNPISAEVTVSDLQNLLQEGDLQKIEQFIINKLVSRDALSTLFLLAAKENNEIVAAYLLTKDIIIDTFDKEGRSALYYSIANNNTNLTKRLIEAGANINLKNPATGESVLFKAVKHKNLEIISLLIAQKCDLNTVTYLGKSLFTEAALTKDVVFINVILDYSVDVKLDQGRGFIFTCGLKNVDLVKRCVSLGSHLNSKDQFGYTALMSAVNSGEIAVVQYLLSQGADKSRQNRKGQTALDIAKNLHFDDIVALLTI